MRIPQNMNAAILAVALIATESAKYKAPEIIQKSFAPRVI